MEGRLEKKMQEEIMVKISHLGEGLKCIDLRNSENPK